MSKVNITGLLRGAQRAIDPDRDEFAYGYMLGEMIQHVEDVRSGRKSLRDFAEYYCLTRDAA